MHLKKGCNEGEQREEKHLFLKWSQQIVRIVLLSEGYIYWSLICPSACSPTFYSGRPQVGFVQMEEVQLWWAGGGEARGWEGGSNGSRNGPCSTTPDSLIMVSAVNVFGVRE